jgi:hypothetical protein
MGDSDECPSTVLHRLPRRGIFLLNLLYVSARGGSVCVYIRFKFLVIRSLALCFSDLYLCARGQYFFHNTRLCKQVLYDDSVWYGGVLEAGPELRDGEGFLVLKFCFPFCG